MSILYPEISKLVIDAFYEVCRNLSVGYAEKVYEKALVYELQTLGLQVEEQKPITVMYKGQLNVGSFIADIVVEDCIILELKATSIISKEHTAQLINYLTCTGKDVGYILNFGGDRRFERRLGPSALHSNAK